MKYLKFKMPLYSRENKNSFFKNIFVKIISTILPKANPDFDEKIDQVFYWLIEFEEDIPNREIGLDENQKAILKMPYKKNYGYWLDNSMKYQDFVSHFDAQEINNKYFTDKWNEFP